MKEQNIFDTSDFRAITTIIVWNASTANYAKDTCEGKHEQSELKKTGHQLF